MYMEKDEAMLPTNDYVFKTNISNAGIFAFGNGIGYYTYYHGFRTVLVP